MLSMNCLADELEDARVAIRTKQFSTAADILRKLVATGDAEAQYQLATLYRAGHGVKKSHREAVKLLNSASAQNHTKAQYTLGVMHEQGWGTAKNNEQARHWFSQAANNGHRLAKSRVSKMSKTTTGNGPSLHHIVSQGNINTLQEYLGNTKHPDVLDKQGRSALFSAIEFKQDSAAKLLIKAGIDIHIVDRHKDNALLYSSRLGNNTVAKLLIRKGARLKTTDAGGNTALHLAAAKGNAKLVSFLSSRMEDKSFLYGLRNLSGLTAIDLARRRDHHSVVAILERHDVPTKKTNMAASRRNYPAKQDKDGQYRDWPALNAAVWQGNKKYLLALLETSDEVDQLDPGKYTALARATLKKQPEIINILLQHGADPTAGAPDNSALILAARSGQHKIVSIMLDRKAPDHMLLNKLLVSASPAADTRLIGRIIENGAEINSVDESSKNSLMHAASAGNNNVVKQLILAGASLDHLDDQKNTALSLAVIGHHGDVVNTLITAGASLQLENGSSLLPVHIAAKEGASGSLKTLLNGGADANARSTSGNTPLIISASNGKISSTTILLAQDIDINAQNKLGNTALMLAAAAGHEEIVRLLLEHDAKMGLRNKKRETAEAIAKARARDNISEVLLTHSKKDKWSIRF